MTQTNAILKARNDGYVASFLDWRKKILDFLEKKYLDPKIERETPEAKAILQLAKDLSQFIISQPTPTTDPNVEN